MDDIEAKRVYGDRAGEGELLVAAGIGLVAVHVSADRVGRFGVVHRCDPADVAASGDRVVVATDEDVLLRGAGADAFQQTGFGPAAAVGFDDDGLVAAGPDGRVARLSGGRGGGLGSGSGGSDRADGPDAEAWTDLGRVEADVRAIDGRLLAAADGVYRLPGLAYAGLDDVRDVAAAGPLAATGDGLYSLGNGWMDELSGAFRVVAAGGRGGESHAATAEAFYERGEDGWGTVALPAGGPVVDVAYGDATYAVTADGVVLAAGTDGYRSQSLGVDGVVGCAVASIGAD